MIYFKISLIVFLFFIIIMAHNKYICGIDPEKSETLKNLIFCAVIFALVWPITLLYIIKIVYKGLEKRHKGSSKE